MEMSTGAIEEMVLHGMRRGTEAEVARDNFEMDQRTIGERAEAAPIIKKHREWMAKQ